MYSNNILNFQESTTILNGCTKKSGNLLKAPRTSTLLGNWKNWNMKVTIIPVVIVAFGTVTKGFLKGLEDLEVGGRVEAI